MFRIASISKTITAVGVMRLVEEGKLSLGDRVFGPNGNPAFVGLAKTLHPFEVTIIRICHRRKLKKTLVSNYILKSYQQLDMVLLCLIIFKNTSDNLEFSNVHVGHQG